MVQLRKKITIGSSNDLAPNRRQAIIWTIDSTVYWRIYTSLSLDDGWRIKVGAVDVGRRSLVTIGPGDALAPNSGGYQLAQ